MTWVSGPSRICSRCAGVLRLKTETWDAAAKCFVGQLDCRECGASHLDTRKATQIRPKETLDEEKEPGMTTRQQLYPHVLKTIAQTLPHPLNDDELRQRGDELASIIQAEHAEQSAQVDQKAQMKARLAELESKKTTLANVINRREEMRETKVTLFLTPHGTVEYVRDDTRTVVHTRAASDAELQQGLDFEKEAEEAVSQR